MSALAAELASIDLGDKRLNRRAGKVLEALGEKPTASIPAACGGWNETKAAYRLFDQAEVTAEAVLAPHIACTEERLRAHPRVLCIQDTTELLCCAQHKSSYVKSIFMRSHFRVTLVFSDSPAVRHRITMRISRKPAACPWP